jgi:hypothetical protein
MKPVTALAGLANPPAAPMASEDVREVIGNRAQTDSKRTFNEPQQAAIEFRNELLDRQWPDAAQMSALTGAQLGLNEAKAYAASLRNQRVLLGVWSIRDRGFRYPGFQFETSGQLRSDVAELLAILPDNDDRGGWRRAFWLYSPHARLDGAEPAEVFVTDPQRVIMVAKQQFGGDRDASW